MEHLPIIDDGKLLSECEPDDSLLPVIVNVFSLHDIGVVLETHVNNPLQIVDQSSSARGLIPIPVVDSVVVNYTSAKATQENCSISQTADKKFACTYCWRKFDYKFLLETHVRTHTGEKPFSCHYCDYSSTQKQNLNRHLRKHTGEKPHVCDVCGKMFRQKSHLKDHSSIHTGEKPYSCNVCGMSFACKGRLKRHDLTHTGQKSHKCDLCDKMFTWKGDLSRHIRTHTKPFGCDTCGKMFADSGVRNKHSKCCSLLKKGRINKMIQVPQSR